MVNQREIKRLEFEVIHYIHAVRGGATNREALVIAKRAGNKKFGKEKM